MKIRRIIIYDKKKVKYSMLIEEVKRNIKKSPIFIGTTRQWNNFLNEAKKSSLLGTKPNHNQLNS